MQADEIAAVLAEDIGDERGGRAEALVKAVTPGLIAQEHVVGKLWAIIAKANTVETMLTNSKVPGVLSALAELALPQCPSLIAQQVSALDTIIDLIAQASAPGVPSDKASNQRKVLIGSWRLIAALSTHPITNHLLSKGLDILARQALELRTDDEILLHVVTFCGNVAADKLALAICEARIPRLLARLICEPQVAAEVKEQIVLTANSLARNTNPNSSSTHDSLLTFPDALAFLTSSKEPKAAAEGIWALHCLVTKGGTQLAARLQTDAPAVLTALEPHAQAHSRATTQKHDELALAQRVAKLTLDDIRQASSS